MNKKDPMQKATKPKRMRRLKDPMSSVSSGQSAGGPDAHAAHMKTPERPLHDYLAEVCECTDVRKGVPLPMGTHEYGGGVNFAFFCRHASRVRLELFDQPVDTTPASWVDWTHLEQHQEIYRFAHGMIAFRRAHPILSKEHFYTDVEISWFNSQQGLPNWADPKEKQFACLIHEDEQNALCLLFNAGADGVDFRLPPVRPEARWHLAVDTSHEAPQDLFAAGKEPLWEDAQTYRLNPRSSAILLARGTNGQRWQTGLTEAK